MRKISISILLLCGKNTRLARNLRRRCPRCGAMAKAMPSFIPRLGLFVEHASIRALLLPLASNLQKAAHLTWKELHFTNPFSS